MTSALLPRRPPLGVFHCTFTAAAALAVALLLASVGAAVAQAAAPDAVFGDLWRWAVAAPPHELAEMLATTVVFAGLVGGLVAVFFNLFARSVRR